MINKNKIKEFWKKTLLEARQIPLQPTQIQLQESVPYIVEKITYKSLNGFLITCLLSKPAGKTNKLPAIITIPGYGGWEQSITLSECQRGYVILQVFPRKQGLSSKLRPGEKISGPGYLLQDIENPEGYFYQGAYIDVIRGIDYLATRGDVDTKRIGIMGTSQGGGIALSVSTFAILAFTLKKKKAKFDGLYFTFVL
ncbi:MAG TPA: acetylxylan esterase [bacterium]|nr:acetylxylan esterase [bacterium]